MLTMAPKSVPCALTISLPPLKIVVGSAIPPAETISLPPLDTDASLAVPPADTISMPPLDIVALTSIPPDCHLFSAAAQDRRAAGNAPGDDQGAAGADGGAEIGTTGQEFDDGAAADRVAGGDLTRSQRQNGAGGKLGADRNNGAADELQGTAGRDRQPADRRAGHQHFGAPSLDDRAAGGTAGFCDLHAAGRNDGALGKSVVELGASGDHRANVGAAGADDLGAAAEDLRWIGQAAGSHQQHAAAADDCVARQTAELDDLRAGEDNSAACPAAIELRSAGDAGAQISAADDLGAATADADTARNAAGGDRLHAARADGRAKIGSTRKNLLPAAVEDRPIAAGAAGPDLQFATAGNRRATGRRRARRLACKPLPTMVALTVVPADTTCVPPEISALKSLPPALTTSPMPALRSVVPLAVPPALTVCRPPLTMVPAAVPPLPIICAPEKIVAPPASPETNWVPPEICAPASLPRALTTSLPPTRIVPLAEAPEPTRCEPLTIVAPTAEPKLNCVPPDIVAPWSVPPALMISLPPLRIVPLAVPPARTTCAPLKTMAPVA